MAFLCLVLAIYVFHTLKKDPKTAWIMEGVILADFLFNIGYIVSDCRKSYTFYAQWEA